jgi:hypothetical protein
MSRLIRLLAIFGLVAVLASSASITTAEIATKKSWKPKIPISLPIPLPTDPNEITFANILDHVTEIPEAAWRKVQETIDANSDVTLKVDVFTGPHTVFDIDGGADRIREVIRRTSRLWSGFRQSKYVSVLAYNAKDERWAEKKWAKIVVQRGYDSRNKVWRLGAIRGNCQSSTAPGVFTGPITTCGGADAGSVWGSPEANIALGQLGGSTGIYGTGGGIIGHEYTHAAVAGNWIGSPNCKGFGTPLCFRSGMSNHGFSPCWLNEGLPQAAGVAAASETLSSYLEWVGDRPYGWGPTTITDYTQPSLRNYLFNQSRKTCYDNGALYRLGYSVGGMAVEALIAIGGPQSVMAMYALGAGGKSFSQAFKSVYGISWAEASTILSKVLAAEYASVGQPPH